MRGIAKIKLIDAKTGRVKQEFEDHNIVTNAINNMLNDCASKLGSPMDIFGHHSAMDRGIHEFLGWLYVNNSMVHLFNGVLLLSEQQALTNKFPKGDFVGVASSSESALNTIDTTKEGAFIPAESGEITGGYKFVWQWGTNQANGTVNSICLVADDNFTCQIPGANDCRVTTLQMGPDGMDARDMFVPYFDGEYWYYVKDTKEIVKVKFAPMTIANSNYQGFYSLDYNAVETVLNAGTYLGYGPTTNGATVREYGGYLYFLDRDSSYNATLRKINKTTGGLVDSISLGVVSVFSVNFDINANYIVVVKGFTLNTTITLEVFDHSGNSLRTIDLVSGSYSLSNAAYVRFIDGTDEVFVNRSYNQSGYTSDISANAFGFFKADVSDGAIQYKAASILGGGDIVYYPASYHEKYDKEILWAHSAYNKDSGFAHRFPAPFLLNTINNLATPITKTDQDILKIEYTLVEA